jgi:hypothetical protein
VNTQIQPVLPAAAHDLVDSAQVLASRIPFDYSIGTRTEFAEAAETLRSIKSRQKLLEEERVKATGPLNQALRTINDWFKKPAQMLTGAESILKRAMAAFESAEQARIREHERIDRQRREQEQHELERRAIKAAEQGKSEKAAQLQERAQVVASAPITQTVAPKAAQIAFTKMWKFRVIDPSLVPRAYLTVDEQKIGQYVRAMKESAEKIPGVEIYSEDSVRAGAAR